MPGTALSSRKAPNPGSTAETNAVSGCLAWVPLYYFHLRDDISADDEEGRELPNLDAARAQAEAYARDMSAASVLEHGKINLHHRIEVADESGSIVSTVEFGDVVAIEG